MSTNAEAAPGQVTAPTTDDSTPQHRIERVVEAWQRWWRISVTGTIDQSEVIEKRREEAYTSPRYLFMIAMSAGIAVLGMLLSSPAVVIGAMLIAPLMGPIMGAGFAFAIGDYGWLRGSAKALVAGTLLGVGLCALIVFVSPLQTVTPEIASRTRPNLFDLAIALFSSMAGAYSMIRGREGTIVGVAIATALMPPLAAVGFGLATLNWTVFSGALLLYVTNLMTIALTATVMARIYGFSARLSEKQSDLQTGIIVIVFIALAIPLSLALRQIVMESSAARQIRTVVAGEFDPRSRLSEIDIDWNSRPYAIDATVLTPRLNAEAEDAARAKIEETLGRPVTLRLTQYRVGTSETAAEQAELSATLAREEEDQRFAGELATRLAVVAQVPDSEVLVDREKRRAVVEASPLPDGSLADYRALERRVAATAPEWQVELVPPALPLPAIPFEDGEPTDAGRSALDLVAWAASRVDLPVELVGGSPETREFAAERLRAAGIDARLVVGGPVMQARWAFPDTGASDDAE